MEYTEVKTCALFADGWLPLQILTDKAQQENQPASALAAPKSSAR